jgi:hypothetical protein
MLDHKNNDFSVLVARQINFNLGLDNHRLHEAVTRWDEKARFAV